MTNQDPIITAYFQSVPEYSPDKTKASIARFSEVKDEVINSIASNLSAVKYIIDECWAVVNNNEQLSNIICDCDDEAASSVTTKAARESLINRLEFLGACPDELKYDSIYHLKFKSTVLIKALRAGNNEDLACKYIKARNDMAEANARLVVYIIKRYQKKGIDMSDLIQEGNLGLLTAIDKFDYKKITKFTTMATHWIKLYATRAVATRSKVIRTPIYLNNSINKLNKAIEALVNQLDRAPNHEELAAQLGWKLDKVARVATQARNTVYIINDSNLFDEEDSESKINSIPDLTDLEEIVTNRLDLASIRSQIETTLHCLTPRQEKVMRLKYGFTDEIHNDEITYDNVGEQMGGITKQRVDQLHQSAIKSIKKKCKEQPVYRKLMEFWEIYP